MIRHVRAFFWLRWRTEMNRLTRSHGRDTLEQISRAVQSILPIVTLAMALPSILILAIAGFVGGRAMARSGTAELFDGIVPFVVRLVLLLVLVAIPLAPIVRSGRDRDSGLTRLLLLPMRRGALHLSELVAGFSDFWLGMCVPPVLTLPLGLAAGGRPGAAAWMLAIGLAFLLALGSLNSSISFGLALVLRKRGRAEWVTVAFMMVFGLIFLVPGLSPDGWGMNEAQRAAARSNLGSGLDAVLPVWTRALPGELLVRSLTAAVAGNARAAATAGAGLAAWALAGLLVSWRLYLRRIRNPDQEGTRRAAGELRIDAASPPGVRPATWAAARAFMRLTVRTVRGKLATFMNFPIVGLSMLLLLRQVKGGLPDHALLQPAAFGSLAGFAITTLSLHVVTVNQFAIDGPGLTLQALTPLSTAGQVRGKALGGGILTAGSTLACMGVAMLVAPPSAPWLCLLLIPVLLGVYLVLAPLHAILSATFPRVVDLSKLGKAGNPHSGAALLAIAFTAVLTACGALPLAAAYLWKPGPLLPALAASGTLALAALLYPFLDRFAIAWVERRRENLLLVAGGR